MASLNTNYVGSYTLSQQNDTKFTFNTASRYLDKNIQFTVGAQSATPSFKAAPTGSSSASPTSITLSTSSNDSKGITIQTKYTINAANILYSAAANGWINKSANADTNSDTTAVSDANGQIYYVTALTVPSSKTFPVTAIGTAEVTANKSGTTPQGTIIINAYPPSSGSTIEDPQTVVENGRWKLTNVGAAGTYYGQVTIGSGSATPSVVDHTVTTPPKVTGALAGKITTIGTTTQPSGTDGTDYWSITPSTTLTNSGTSSSKAKATVTAGYVSAGTPTTAAHTIDIVPERADGAKRYLPKAGITATKTSGSITPTASLTDTNNVTWNQNNLSGIAITANGNGSVSNLNIAANVTNAGYAPQANNYATATNLSIAAAANNATETKYLTGVTIQAPDSGERTFSITVPNGSTTITFVFHVDSNGNVTVTE